MLEPVKCFQEWIAWVGDPIGNPFGKTEYLDLAIRVDINQGLLERHDQLLQVLPPLGGSSPHLRLTRGRESIAYRTVKCGSRLFHVWIFPALR